MSSLLLLLFLLGAPQDPAALVAQLGAEDIAVRERAFAELEKLGAAAEAHLKKAIDDPDRNISGKARLLIRIIELDRTFSPALKKSLPGIVKKMASEGDDQWPKLYLEIWWGGRRTPERLHPELTREDLEPLAAMALRHVGPGRYSINDKEERSEKEDVLEAIATWKHRSAETEVIKLLGDPSAEIQAAAQDALVALRGRGAISEFLKAYSGDRLVDVLETWSRLDQIEAVPRLLEMLATSDTERASRIGKRLGTLREYRIRDEAIKLLRHDKPSARVGAILAIGVFGTRFDAPLVVPLLEDPEVRRAASEVAVTLGLELKPERMAALAKDWDVAIRANAARLVEKRTDRKYADLLKELSRDPAVPVRLEAVKALGQLYDRRGGDALAERLKDESPEIRVAAIQSLEKCDAFDKAEAVAALLDDPDEKVQNAAEYAVGPLRWAPGYDRLARYFPRENKRNRSALLPLLVAADPVRARPELDRIVAEADLLGEEAVDLIATQSDPVPSLLKALEGLYNARDRAISALARMRPPGIAPRLRERLKETKGEAKYGVLRGLDLVVPEEVRAEWTELFASEDQEIRLEAIRALSRITPGPEVQALRDLLSEENDQVRWEAVECLRHWKCVEAAADFRELLGDEEEEVAASAARALFEFKDPALRPAVLKWIESGRAVRQEDSTDRNTTPTRAAVGEQILSILGPADSVPRVAALLKHRDPDVRRRAALVLGRWGAREVASALLPLLRDEETREEAIDGLAMMEASGVAKDLVAILDSPNAEGRGAAMLALLAVDLQPVSTLMRRLTRDPEAEVRGAAIATLGRLKDRESTPLLIELLKSGRAQDREDAAFALAEFDSPEAIQPLFKMLEDPDRDVQQRAMFGVMDFKSPESKAIMLEHLRNCPNDGTGMYGWIQHQVEKQGIREAIPILKSQLEEPGGYSVAATLAKLGDGEPLAAFRKRTDLGLQDRHGLALELSLLGDHEPAERYFKEIVDPEMRATSARYFTYNTSPAATGILVQELNADDQGECHSLNAIRNRPAWEKLHETRYMAPPRGTIRKVVDLIGIKAGLPVRWPEPKSFEEHWWPQVKAGFRSTAPHVTYNVLNLLTSQFETNYDAPTGYNIGFIDLKVPYDFILEKDHIRVLPRRDAIAFWKKWWADGQPKLK